MMMTTTTTTMTMMIICTVQALICSLKGQLEDIKCINLEMYTKLAVGDHHYHLDHYHPYFFRRRNNLRKRVKMIFFSWEDVN